MSSNIIYAVEIMINDFPRALGMPYLDPPTRTIKSVWAVTFYKRDFKEKQRLGDYPGLWDTEWQCQWGLCAPYGLDSFPGVCFCLSPLILPFPGAILGAILVKYLVKYLSEK